MRILHQFTHPKITLSILFLSITLIGTAQQSRELPKSALESITATELKNHLYTIASDKMEGRQTGSKGQKKAGKYLIQQYHKMGVSFPKPLKSFYQKIPAAYLNAKHNEDLPDSENILAFIPGTEQPEEIVVISAHYDHLGIEDGKIYNGADDDGSGTVALLEIAQAFKLAHNSGNGPKRSILILHATGEEHGLHGSRYYTEHPVFPLAKTVADINIDMIGRRDSIHLQSNKYVYLVGSDRLSTELDAICQKANATTVNLDLDYKYNDLNDPERIYYRSDHYNFAKNYIPSVFLFNGVHEDYHQPTDRPEKIEYDALELRTKLAFAIAWELANQTDFLKIDRDGK